MPCFSLLHALQLVTAGVIPLSEIPWVLSVERMAPERIELHVDGKLDRGP